MKSSQLVVKLGKIVMVAILGLGILNINHLVAATPAGASSAGAQIPGGIEIPSDPKTAQQELRNLFLSLFGKIQAKPEWKTLTWSERIALGLKLIEAAKNPALKPVELALKDIQGKTSIFDANSIVNRIRRKDVEKALATVYPSEPAINLTFAESVKLICTLLAVKK